MSISRKDKLKNLMRDRTTVEQGLTLGQIFNEVYPELVEEYHKKYHGKNYDTGQQMSTSPYDYNEWKVNYLKHLIKEIKKEDEFRWLSIMPVKRNEVKDGKKVRPYVEYRYININPTKTPELLSEVNKIWLRHAEGCIKGLDEKTKRLNRIAERSDEQQKQSVEQVENLIKYQFRIDRVLSKSSTTRMIEELKTDHLLPISYQYDSKRMYKIFRDELLNNTQRHAASFRNYKELYNIVKDIMVGYCNKKDYDLEMNMIGVH